ncbi:MAG: LysM peptidoglycan-binding domain-containing protein [Cytophagales bacterium]|nr:LysM peptidoglycan-binding domain-containing protein [Rhizobacter sp.]
MTRSTRPALSFFRASAITVALGIGLGAAVAAEPNFPITQKQRSTANQVAETGVPLSELAENAPDVYTVKSGDTLWAISRMYLKSPWRWPELWGMNLEQIRNPHLIFPGQTLYLVKSNGRATLRVGDGDPGASGRLSPRIRSSDLNRDGIPAIALHLIEPFLNEAVIFDENQLATAPRIVGAQEGRVLLSRGDLAYVRGDVGGNRNFRVFREPRPLKDPTTGEVLGYEAVYLGVAEYTRKGNSTQGEIVPDTFTISSVRQEIRVGDKLSPVPPREFTNYVPRAPGKDIAGQIVSIYGDSLTAGQNQIVALNRGSRDGMESGHVLALWRDGVRVIDKTDGGKTTIKLPDERHGNLFVFRVFNRMSYALILSVKEPVSPGDRFTQP